LAFHLGDGPAKQAPLRDRKSELGVAEDYPLVIQHVFPLQAGNGFVAQILPGGLLTAFKRYRLSALLLLSILQVPGLSVSMLGQEERGTVKVDSLPVYAEMSTDSNIVTTLARGKLVRVTLSATNGEGSWCSIADIDSSVKLAFVRCEGLDRQNVPSTAASGAGALSSAPFDATSSNQPRSRTQERWALAASAILSTYNQEPLDTISSGDSVLEERRFLQNSWEISNHDDLLKTLEWIDQGGHRQLFSALGARAANLSPDELSRAVSHLGPEDANSVVIAHRYYEKYSSKSITAWDYARYINVCRWGVAAGYISEEEAWPRVMHAAQILQQTFTSWREFGENYLVGREFWSLRQTKIDGQAMRAVYQGLLNRPGSPWNRIPWNLPLQQSYSKEPNPPSLPPSAQSANSSAATGPCDALLRVAASGEVSDVESILQTKPDPVNCRDTQGWTPLHNAAFNGQTKLIQILVEHGDAVDATDKEGATPLHAAAFAGHPDAIEVLLQSGARINALDRHGDTPLDYAAAAGSSAATDVLLRHHAATEERGSKGDTPLNSAAVRGYTDVVRLLVEHGANVESRDNQGFTPLSSAVSLDRTDVIVLLLGANANVNTRSNNGSTPLNGAAAKGSVESASQLLEHGARVNAGNAHGFTPLHTAADYNQPEVAEFLIAHGADINARTDAGDTPLHWAAFNGKTEVAKLLLAKGAQVSPSDKDGNTPLHWAAGRGHVEMTELLIAHGANMKALTRSGCTPLRGAHDYHQAATAQVLLRHGATE
jgi:ankyrin repeat protein